MLFKAMKVIGSARFLHAVLFSYVVKLNISGQFWARALHKDSRTWQILIRSQTSSQDWGANLAAQELGSAKLCNGTRLTIRRMMPNMLEAVVMTGKARGEQVFIRRIPIIPSDTTIEFKRLQFPVRLSYAMTINKSQGQSLKVVGLDISTPVFSHGQLYLGCSRTGTQATCST